MAKKDEPLVKDDEQKFNKRAILRSVKWSPFVDHLSPFLDDDGFYTEAEIDAILETKFDIKRSV